MNKQPAIQLSIRRIRCDECHHEFEGEPIDYLDKACGECGQGILITQADLDNCAEMQRFADLINSMLGPVPEEMPMQTIELQSINGVVQLFDPTSQSGRTEPNTTHKKEAK